jgi:hypothetical protein
VKKGDNYFSVSMMGLPADQAKAAVQSLAKQILPKPGIRDRANRACAALSPSQDRLPPSRVIMLSLHNHSRWLRSSLTTYEEFR